MAPKVLHLSTYSTNGGAARAATALHEAMLAQGLESEMWTAHGAKFKRAQFLDRQLWRLQSSPIKTWRSPARFGSLTANEINASDADIVNLHWVTDGFLSIEEIGKIDKPIVWSLYDMWPFAGTEHYGTDTEDARWRTGYTRANRPRDERGLDIDRWAWQRKKAHWATPMHIVSASTWLQDGASSSALMSDWSHRRIPHVVDTESFAPLDMALARSSLKLPVEAPIILFLASAGIADRRKGFDLLEQALPLVQEDFPNLSLAIAGPIQKDMSSVSGVPIHWLGQLQGDEALRTAYSAADVVATPSREDNLPLTVMEAQSCGRLVTGFRIGGLRDLVDEGTSGYLAEPFSADDLGVALRTCLERARASDDHDVASRARALRIWSPKAVVPQYQSLYSQVLA